MNGSPIRSAVVVGGGITGLTLAFHLQRRGVEVRLVEAASRWGGVISTDVLVFRDGEKLRMKVPSIVFRSGFADFDGQVAALAVPL